MSWSPSPSPGLEPSDESRPGSAGPELVAQTLDPVLTGLGFAPGQLGVDGDHAQITFCRGEHGTPDGGCVDLVVDLQAKPAWGITDVRYWGFPSDRWHLEWDREAAFSDQLNGLARTVLEQLG